MTGAARVLCVLTMGVGGCGAAAVDREPAPPGAHKPAKGADGVYENCEVLHDGWCYRSESDACRAAGCPGERCIILESYPGQVSCQEQPETGETSEHVAPPFSAGDLRAGLVAGTEIKLRVAQAGQDPVIQHWVFTAADEKGCTIHARVLAEDGSVIKDEGEGTSTWDELLTHAQFPAARTTRTDSSIDVPAGHFETWYFEVRPDKPGGPTKHLHFARELPGPPVWMEVTQGDEVVLKMELVSRTQP